MMKKIPSMPQEIIDAIDDSKLLIFIGAGLSKLFGYPRWRELGISLADRCVEEKAITRSEKDVLTGDDFTPMQLVTIAYDRLSKKCGDKAKDILKKELSEEKVKEDKSLIKEISEYLSNYCCPIITTNADLSLDRADEFKSKVILNSFDEWSEDDDFANLIHLHGSINKVDNMVFTSEQYAKAYMADADFGKKLLNLFNKGYTVLFIGYGVSEFELIRYFLRAKNDDKDNLFMLSGYLEKDEIRKSFDEDYFSSMGITVLPYSIEKDGYIALKNVLRKWNNIVTKKTLAHVNPTKKIKEAFSKKPTTSSSKMIRGSL